MHEALGRLSHREYNTRMEWLDQQWEKPDRHDWYLMQIAQEVRYQRSRKRTRPPLGKMKVSFELTKSSNQTHHIVNKPTQEALEIATAASKGRWLLAMGPKAKAKWRQTKKLKG